jgi:hypothetical protein
VFSYCVLYRDCGGAVPLGGVVPFGEEGFELGGVLVPGLVVLPGVVLLGGVVGVVDVPGVVLGEVVPGVVPAGEVRIVPSGFTQGVVIPAEAPAEADGFDGLDGVPACACPAAGVVLPLTPEQG